MDETTMRELQRAKDDFSRPIRHCNLAHEDVLRDGKGSPLLEKASFVLECRTQHFACPHFFASMVARYSNVLNAVTSAAPARFDLRDRLKAAQNALIEMDTEARIARTNVVYEESLSDFSIPSAEEARGNVAPIVEDYNKFLEETMEELQRDLLSLIDRGLERCAAALADEDE